MSLVQAWGESAQRNLSEETELERLYGLDSQVFKELCFACLRGTDREQFVH